MPNPFTYPALNLLTGKVTAALPYQGVSFGQSLNQPGPWTGQISLNDPRVQALGWDQASAPTSSCTFVDYNGTLVWGGINWTRSYDSADPMRALKVGASEFGSYWQRRVQSKDYGTTFASGEDPMLIVQQIISDANSNNATNATNTPLLGMAGMTLVLNSPYSLSAPYNGFQVAPSYPGTSLQTIDSIVSLLSQMGYQVGFDYSFDVAYIYTTTGVGAAAIVTKVPSVVMNLWFPRQGQTFAQKGLQIFTIKDGSYTYPEDGSQQATGVAETGSGTGGISPVAISAAIPGYPLVERTFSRTQITDQATLTNVAEGDLGIFCYPVVTPTFKFRVTPPNAAGVIPPTATLPFGSWGLGDDLLMTIDPVSGAGENTDPRFPNGMSFEWRIIGWTCQVADSGAATVTLDLGIPPLQTVPPPAPPL